MDTATHIGMGLGLSAIATLSPEVSGDAQLFLAMTATALVGSHAPDFDTVFKLKGNSTYLRQHRGRSHGITALLAWPIIVSAVIGTVLGVNPASLWVMAQIAVLLHVTVDLFNAYGTQALQPFSKKWIGWGVIGTFDPYLFSAYYGAYALWMITGATVPIFALLIALVISYYAIQFKLRNRALATVARHFAGAHELFISPGIGWDDWHVAVRFRNGLGAVKVKKGKVIECGRFRDKPMPGEEDLHFVEARKNADLQAFLEFSKIHTYTVTRHNGMIEYRFTNLRYFSKNMYPFVAVVIVDEQTNDVLSSFTGWVFSEDSLQKKLVYEQ